MDIARIIVCIVLSISLMGVVYGFFEGIRTKNERLALICSMALVLIGLLTGFYITNII